LSLGRAQGRVAVAGGPAVLDRLERQLVLDLEAWPETDAVQRGIDSTFGTIGAVSRRYPDMSWELRHP
jgi:hypothetical protein